MAKRPLRWIKRGAKRYLKLSIIVLVGTSLCPNQGRIQDFFRRRCTRLLLSFNTNKPHSFFFAKYQLGGGVRNPCILPLDPPLQTKLTTKAVFPYILRFVVQERVNRRLMFHQNTVVCKYLASLVVKRRRQAKNIP